MTDLLILCAFSMTAGFVDAAVGGGGLIQLPAALILLPGVAIPTVLGTNKFASLFGTSFALQRYARHVKIDWHTVAPAAGVAFLFAFAGARAVNLLDPKLLRPIILVLLVAVATYVLLAKNLGLIHAPKHRPQKARWLGVGLGAVLGFYDGFFGPGMGSFLIFAFVGIFGFDFLSASASAKAVNWATNFASLIYFGATGQILFKIGAAMAVSNIIGSIVGTRLAIAKGSRFVRILFLVVVGALIAKLTQTLIWP
ncbi:MAG: TSUP family transporter [Verrucomicrobiota bacterium]|nr:TSUP family transporter [Verrucomicrobiota bacterium]